MRQNPEPELLTIAELSRALDIPESTARYYCNRFAEYLPASGEGRRRRFTRESLDVLRKITEIMRRDKNSYAVDLALRGESSAIQPFAAADSPPLVAQEWPAAPSEMASRMVALMEAQTRALQDIAGAMTAFAGQLDAGRAMAALPAASAPPAVPPVAAAAPAAAEEDALKAEITALRAQIRSSESVHQNDIEQLRKWLARLGEALGGK